MNKLIVFGANGMLGSYICNYFKQNTGFNVIEINRESFDVDKHNDVTLEKLLQYCDIDQYTVVFNAIGVIPQTGNMNERNYIKVNSVFPHVLALLVDKYGAKMIQPATDCVYDGTKGKPYVESDLHDAKSIYGISKSIGEPSRVTVIRASIIGEERKNKRSLLEWVKSKRDTTINGYTNHYWNGITCLQYAKIVYQIVTENIFWNGVRHLLSPRVVSKYELLKVINNVYDLNITVVPITIELCDRRLDTIYDTNLGFDIPDIEDQIKEIFKFGLFN